ncbi:MAG: orotate phosphoribosyltransferase [Candidatus Limnocylindria bacterium]
MRPPPADVETVFRAAGALLDGHFLLSSGLHSPRYLEKFRLLQAPRETERLCAAIAERARPLGPATVAGPTTGGIILAHEVARQLGCRAVYAERDDRGGRRRAFRRGVGPEPGERVLVVDDIMSTGGSVQETIAAVREAGGEVVAAAVLADRSAGRAGLDVPLIALWEVTMPAYEPDRCPQCAAGEPLRKPGTTPAPDVPRG